MKKLTLNNCKPFSSVLASLNKEERYKVYEDNYYELQAYKKCENQLKCSMENAVRELIEYRIGKRKVEWLKKQGCEFIDIDNYLGTGDRATIIVTSNNEYVELADLGKNADTVNFIYKHRLTNLMSYARAKGKDVKENSSPIDIGFNEKEQAWYGWTHRGYGKFYVGQEIKKGSIMDKKPHKYPYKVETLEQAKQLALDIVKELS